MKIYGWMQSKLKYGRSYKESSQKPNSKPVNPEPSKEEVSDWLYGLLAIGIFGKNDLQEDLQMVNFQGILPSSSKDPVSDEVGSLQEKLKSLLHKQDDHESASSTEPEHVPLHIRQSNNRSSVQRSTSFVLGRGKEALMDNAESAIGTKSLSFLLKKIFVCSSGFPSGPCPKAPIPESRREKILRAMLQKKIYPQSSGPSLSAKKYLENGHIPKSNEDDVTEKTGKGSKWVKTDSEFGMRLSTAPIMCKKKLLEAFKNNTKMTILFLRYKLTKIHQLLDNTGKTFSFLKVEERILEDALDH